MLYYLHGYQSNPFSEKGILLREALQVVPITYRDGAPEDLVISECLIRIYEVIKKDQQVVLIGSSLGGFLAAATALNHPNVKQLILLNPAIIPPQTDLHTVLGIPYRILKEMIDPRLFEQKIPASITILRGTRDNVVPDDWVICFAKSQQAKIQLYNDDHRFSRNLQKLPVIISALL